MRDYRAVAESEMSMPVSILVPAYNEDAVDRCLAALAAHLAVRRVRDRRDQRRLDRRDDGGADRSLRPRQGRPRAALEHLDAAGPRRLREPARAAHRRHRQGQRRQGRRAQRRHQPRRLPALLRDRRRHDARRRRALAPRLGVPGRAGDGRGRRHRPHRQRLGVRGRSSRHGAHAAKPARQPADHRVPAGLSRRSHRLVEERHAADHLRRLRALPARRLRRGRRL